MSEKSFNCPGFSTAQQGDGVEIQDLANTIPVIIQVVGDKMRVLCDALEEGECRKVDKQIQNKAVCENKDPKRGPCPFAQLAAKKSAMTPDEIAVLSGIAIR